MSILDFSEKTWDNPWAFSSVMNTAQKFFGFLLLPILTFTLGVVLSNEVRLPKNTPEQINGETPPGDSKGVDTAIFWTALKKWEERAEPSEKADIERFRETITNSESILQNAQKLDLTLFWEALRMVQQKYVEPEKIDFTKIAEWIIRGLVYSLDDPYSNYMTKEESQEFGEELAGELEGIGAELTTKNGFITVISPIKDSPAAKAGVLPDDVITEVDGEDIAEFTLNEVVQKIRGKQGTKVTLTILRKTESEPLKLEITRAHIVVETVNYEVKDDIVLIEVNQFGDNTEKEFERYLRQAIAGTPRGLILDLRFNPGGYLETAISMVSAFVKEGKVVVQKERSPDISNRFVTGKVLTDLPLIVLINGGSASASEIVAGALQDHGRALILGEKSFGKGTVQEIMPLSDGSNLRITVAKWLTPKGRDIGAKGIEPDIEVLRTEEDFEAVRDPQMETALKILRGELTAKDFPTMSENAKHFFGLDR